MKTFALAYLSTAMVMLGLDAIWLSLSAGPLYRAQLGSLLLPKFQPLPAALFYLLYVLGLVVLVVMPAVSARGWEYALVRGALFGCVAYATYDLTNQATLRGWSTVVTLADLAWGTTLSAVAATVAYLVVKAVLIR